MSLKGVPRIYGPQVKDGVLLPELVNTILAMWRELQAIDGTVTEVEQTAEAAAASAANPIPYYGTNGVTVLGAEIRGPGVASGAGTPTLIPEEEVFTVSANSQALYRLPITIDGTLVLDGALVEV